MWLDETRKDIAFALRTMVKRPMVPAIVIVSLALAIGANAALFSLIKAAFFYDLGVDAPEAVVEVFGSDEKTPGRLPFSFPNFEDLRDQNDTFEGMAATRPILATLSGGSGHPERLFGQIVSAGFFDVLGVEAARGRTFLPEDYERPPCPGGGGHRPGTGAPRRAHRARGSVADGVKRLRGAPRPEARR